MTTAAQVRKLVKPLLARHPDLALVGRMIVVPPVRHILRAIHIDRTGDSCRFKPKWLVIHLFERSQRVWLNLGGDIYKPRPTSWHRESPNLWWIDDPASPEVLVEAVEAAVLPRLAVLDVFENYYAHLTSVEHHTYHLRPYQRVIVEAARGRLDEVRTICRDELSKWPDDTYGKRPEEIDIIRLPKMICPLAAADNRAGIAALLHEWEATTVKNLKIEHLWQPTPFPLELGKPAR
jgi:hypothetical protein